MSWLGAEGSTRRLLQLCAGYFIFYVITGVTVKYFLNSSAGFPGMQGMEFLVYSTTGGMAIASVTVIALRWYRLKSNRMTTWGPLTFPREFIYIIPSGVCTAVVIPTTTLMYSLPISVMVAMVIMRGSVIIISRIVDAIQIRQGILDKKVYLEENLGVVFALCAVGVHLLTGSDGGFDFVANVAAMTILGCYLSAYSVRIYIMNYYKNTRPKGAQHDNRGFFAIEQLSALAVVGAVALVMFLIAANDGSPNGLGQLPLFYGAITEPRPLWQWAILAGMAFGVVSFFSVFIFMYKGRTATFAGLVNRLTSLIAGTTATLVFAVVHGGKMPTARDWGSVAFIVVAVTFLARAERRRAAELSQQASE